MSQSTLAPRQFSLPLPLIVVAVLTALSVASALLGPVFEFHDARYEFLVAASTGFVLVALLAGAWRHTYGRLVLAGLGLCWCGDVLGPYNFALGAGMFLLAHLCFIAAFVAHGLDRKKLLPSLALIIPSLAVFLWLNPQVEPDMRPLIIAYTLVITVMVVAGGATNRLIFSAALVFYVSDVFVANWRFVDQDSSNAFYCYPLYYTACLLFAISTAISTATTRDPPPP